MDLVSPKSVRDHEYVLVVIDYATRYPEALPLLKVTFKAIAKKLVLLFSCVGQPAVSSEADPHLHLPGPDRRPGGEVQPNA